LCLRGIDSVVAIDRDDDGVCGNREQKRGFTSSDD
jgi:hypothetical protein